MKIGEGSMAFVLEALYWYSLQIGGLGKVGRCRSAI